MVSEIWRAFGLKPWEIVEFKISPDPQLVAKIRDIVDPMTINETEPSTCSPLSTSRPAR
jgi:hypothetical protein